MSNQFLKLRRSSVPGKVPTTSSLEFGEIALNTYDGLAFIKKSGSFGEEVVTLGTGVSASYATTSSFAFTAAYALSAANVFANQIGSGSVTASADVGYDGIFLVRSGSYVLFEMSGSGETTLNSNLFIVKNFSTQQSVLTVSESVVNMATQSVDPLSPTDKAGSFWFTSTDLYVSLE